MSNQPHPTGNPNHPVTQATASEWHKLCAIMMHKLGLTKIQISAADIATFMESGRTNISVRFGDVITLELLDDEQARELAKKEGGLPV